MIMLVLFRYRYHIDEYSEKEVQTHAQRHYRGGGEAYSA